MSKPAPTKCDCTVYCGDDPWLKTGQCTPCDGKLARDRAYRLHNAAPEMYQALKKLSGIKLGMVADGIVDKALAKVEGKS